MVFFQQIAPYLLLQLSVALFLLDVRWPVALFIFSLYSKFVDMTINLSLILQTTRIQKQFPLSVFVFIDSLVVSASQDVGGYAISHQNNLELHLGCHTYWLRYFTLVCLWCGRTVGQACSHMITKISRMGSVLTHGAPLCTLRACGAPLILHLEFRSSLVRSVMNTDRHLQWPGSSHSLLHHFIHFCLS